MPKSIRLLIVDEHEVYRLGLAALLDGCDGIEVAGQTGDSGEALRITRELTPDVILLDIQMAASSGLDTLAKLRIHSPESKVVVLTVSETDADIAPALNLGISGYTLKTADLETLVRYIKVAANGDMAFSTKAMTTVLQRLKTVEASIADSDSQTDLFAKLTAREREIATFLPMGASNKKIAQELFISEHTVRAHLRNILDKMGLKNRAQAAAYTARSVRQA